MGLIKNFLRKYRAFMNRPVIKKLEKMETKRETQIKTEINPKLEAINKNLVFFINQSLDITKVKTQPSLAHIQKQQLDVLRRYDAFLKTINVEYFLIYGSLLGVIRNKSFIPWDDDVDTGMFHEDFHIILENEKKLKDFGLGLSSPFTQENNFIRPGWHKIFDLENTNFHIDVFLFDIINNKDRNKILETKTKYFYLAEKERWRYTQGKLPLETLKDKINELNKAYSSELDFTTKEKATKDAYIIPTFTNFNSQKLTKFEYVFPIKKAEFSVISGTEPKLTVPIPNKNEEMVIDFFGKDYMSFPNTIFPLHPFHFDKE